MHLLIILSSAGLVVLTGWAALRLMPRVRGWQRRRELQLLILAAPVISLGLALGGLHHFSGQTCFLGLPPWDYTLSVGLPLLMGFIALGAGFLGVFRLLLMHGLVARRGMRAGPDLQAKVDAIAQRMGARHPRVLVCADDRPLVLTFGLLGPTLLVSCWMLARLDGQELESVLAHELAHVARRDYLVVCLATVLRDAFFYLPTSWAAHRQLEAEKEYACDDLAVNLTGRPLALASALGRVWQHGLGREVPCGGQALTGADGGGVEARITRLLARAPQSSGEGPTAVLPLGTGATALVGVVAAEIMNVAALLAPIGCTHGMALGKLF